MSLNLNNLLQACRNNEILREDGSAFKFGFWDRIKNLFTSQKHQFNACCLSLSAANLTELSLEERFDIAVRLREIQSKINDTAIGYLCDVHLKKFEKKAFSSTSVDELTRPIFEEIKQSASEQNRPLFERNIRKLDAVTNAFLHDPSSMSKIFEDWSAASAKIAPAPEFNLFQRIIRWLSGRKTVNAHHEVDQLLREKASMLKNPNP